VLPIPLGGRQCLWQEVSDRIKFLGNALKHFLPCSEFSETVCYYTSGSVPSQPDPPMLSDAYVKSLVISWIKRPNDDEFILQMEDAATVSYFLNAYDL
jgi:hypothetical protein